VMENHLVFYLKNACILMIYYVHTKNVQDPIIVSPSLTYLRSLDTMSILHVINLIYGTNEQKIFEHCLIA
jgi:hypothetical protein